MKMKSVMGVFIDRVKSSDNFSTYFCVLPNRVKYPAATVAVSGLFMERCNVTVTA
jgi:hypothetical protein